MKRILFFMICYFLLLSPASAQKLQTAAWLENDHIIVKCGFGPNEPLQNAEITILQAPERIPLIKGRTDSVGRFVFPVPGSVREGHGLVIVARTPSGSRYEWFINAPELYAASSLIAGFDETRLQTTPDAGQEVPEPAPAERVQTPPPVPNPSPVYPTTPPAMESITREQLTEVLDSRLETQLGSIKKQLADNSFAITVTLVLAAAGLLAALAGLFLYFRQRSR